MFESITHWFASIAGDSKLFASPQDEKLHSALAAVLYHLICADQKVENREKEQFAAILEREFDLDEEQIQHLYMAAESSASDLSSDLHTVNEHLKKNPALRMIFLRELLLLADIGGVHEGELQVFYEVLHEVFPEIKQP